MPQIYLSGQAGCLLPMLIVLNLLFGKLIFESTGLWLVIEAILILIFILKIKFMISRISRQFSAYGQDAASRRHKTDKGVIDVPGQVVENSNQDLLN
jgi:hypothetical protein